MADLVRRAVSEEDTRDDEDRDDLEDGQQLDYFSTSLDGLM